MTPSAFRLHEGAMLLNAVIVLLYVLLSYQFFPHFQITLSGWRWHSRTRTSPNPYKPRRSSGQADRPLFRLGSGHQYRRHLGISPSKRKDSERVPETVLQDEGVRICGNEALPLRSAGNYPERLFRLV